MLPTGLGAERHDLHSYETHASQWIGFRQPVVLTAREREGERIDDTRQANPGEVWEENEFWFELSWRIDPDGSLGIRRHFESPYRPGEKIQVNEYYDWNFENSVPGLVDRAAEEGLAPGEYMRRYGAYEVTTDVFARHERPLPDAMLDVAEVDETTGFVWREHCPTEVNRRPYPGPFRDEHGRYRVGIRIDGVPVQGFPTPSGKLEFFSTTMKEWGWPEVRPSLLPDRRRREGSPPAPSEPGAPVKDRPRQVGLLSSAHVPPAQPHPHPGPMAPSGFMRSRTPTRSGSIQSMRRESACLPETWPGWTRR